MHNLSDRALKERVTGAVVLVVFAVLVVPIFLDGPSVEDEIVSEAVTLPGQNNQERKQQTIVLDRNRSEPVPVSRTPASTQSSPVPAAAEKQEPVAKEEEESKPVAAPASSSPETSSTPADPAASASASETGMWAVQLGSFSSEENAEALASSLRDQGYAAFLSQLQRDNGQLHRVRIGPQKDRASAEAIAAQLAKSGHSGQVVPHP
jgi:DedD protein